MTRLDACYFCGDAGETLRRYDAVPPELDPRESEQRTLVLCPRCRQKLEPVLEPFVARLGGGGGRSAESAGTVAPDESEPTSIGIEPEPEAAERGAEADADPERADDAGGGGDANGTRGAGAEDAETGDSEATSEAGDSEATSEAGDSAEAFVESATPGEGVAIPDPETGRDAAETGESEPADDGESGGAAETEAGDADASADDPETAADDPDASDDGAPSGPARTVPSGYYKVLRLLRNRDLPMARATVQELAASAYDMEVAQVGHILDAAVEEGELAERDGQIRRPEG